MKFSGFIFAAQDRHSQEDRYDFLFRVARYLDENDFEALWTPERHFQEFGGSFPNPAVLSAALAAVTRRLKLRAGSVVVPHHHPVRIAEEWALVDQISKGRVGVCFATGWHKRDFVFYPENYACRREITDSAIAAVRRLWAGQAEPYDAMGETLEVKTYPAPYQRNIPLWLVFSSSLQIWTKAGREGFNVLALLNSWEMIEESIAHYRQAREQHGLDPAAGIVTIGLHTFIGEENDEVRRLVEEPLKSYLGSFLLAKNDDKCLNSVQAPMSVEEKQIILASAFEDYFENRSLLGDLEKCRKVVDRLQGIGVNEVACLIDFGVDFERVFGALDRLTELKNIYADSVRPEAVEEAPEGESKTGDFSWYYNR